MRGQIAGVASEGIKAVTPKWPGGKTTASALVAVASQLTRPSSKEMRPRPYGDGLDEARRAFKWQS